MNNIEPLTPEGWFEDGNEFKGGNKNENGICIPYHSKVNFLWAPTPSVADLVLRKLGEAVQKYTNSLDVFILTKLMMPVRGKMMFKMADLVVYGPPGACFDHPQCTSRLFLVLYPFSPHTYLCGSGGHPRL